MSNPLLVAFSAGTIGAWRIDTIAAMRGDTLANAARLDISEGQVAAANTTWQLRGSTGNARYSTRSEINVLAARQKGLSRPEATFAALIPIRKSQSWWDMAQDERRAIIEERSRHIAIGLDYLPAVARRLHHSRELGEPFDFLTWFEFSPQHVDDFNAMLARLRATEEWDYVEREVDIRLSR